MNTLLQKCMVLFLFQVMFIAAPAQFIVWNDLKTLRTAGNADINSALTKSDEKYIKWNAERVVKRIMDLLNFISTSQGLEATEVDKVIQQSFSQAENRLFYDATCIIEDDLHVTEKEIKPKKKVVPRYLKDFDLLYRKTNDRTVIFSDFETSNIKRNEYLYIKVFYNCLFKTNSIISEQPYRLQRKVAELKIEKVDHTWKTWITNIFDVGSPDTTDASKNDVIIHDNLQADSISIARGIANDPAKMFSNENTSGDEIKKTPEVLYIFYIKEALFAETEKKFEQALNNYQLAFTIKPDEDNKLGKKIRELKTRLENMKLFEQQYGSGLYLDAIAGYNIAIKKDVANIDYYFGRARCYSKTGDYHHALKDYDKIIKMDPSLVQAYRLKGAIFEIQDEYDEAIANYEVCAPIENKIDLYHKIASLQVMQGHLDAAVEAYDKAIQINNKVAYPFHLRGELLYKLNKVHEAEESFTHAISLDPNKANSYFYRGLCRYDLKNMVEAAADFAKAKELKLESRYVQRIPEVLPAMNKANNQ
jgi:tetratricopeptide (TPR) repeat protein